MKECYPITFVGSEEANLGKDSIGLYCKERRKKSKEKECKSRLYSICIKKKKKI